MKRNKFSGYKDVLSFTLRQTTKGTSFKITTFGIALVLFLVMLLITIISATLKDDRNLSPITRVYVLDQSGYSPIDFNLLGQMNDSFAGIQFISKDSNTTIEQASKDMNGVSQTEALLHIRKNNEDFVMSILYPPHSIIRQEDGQNLLNQLISVFQIHKISEIGLSSKQLESINKQVMTSFSTAGEAKESIGEILIKVLAPMLFAFVLYIMLLLYGQSICKSLITEKTSKLLELLLTSVRPYAVISGKVLAMYLLAIGQFLLWLVCGIAGYVIGNIVAKYMNPEYINPVTQTLNLIKNNTNTNAFTLTAIVLGMIALCLGFLFYLVLAGLIGAILSKAEDLSSGMALYQIPVVISFMMAYLIPLQEGSKLIHFVRYFPFTSPFLIPADIVIGNMAPLKGILSILILSVTTVLLILLTSKVYKGMVFFNGNKLGIKNLIAILKAN